MGIYLYGTENLLYEEDVRKMFEIANLKKKALISLLWLTGARPGEIIKLKKEDIKVNETSCEITLYTLKLKQADDKSFATKSRTLVFERPNLYVDTLLEYANTIPLPPSTSTILFPLTTKWVQNAVKLLAMKTMGQRITPYHFRHSVLQHLAKQGWTIDRLKYFKGAASLRSVEAYLHATPQPVSNVLLEARKRNKEIEVCREREVCRESEPASEPVQTAQTEKEEQPTESALVSEATAQSEKASE